MVSKTKGASKQPKIGNGSLTLPLKSGHFYTIWGGRSYDAPESMIFIKLAAEINKACDYDMPVADFKVPTKTQVDEALAFAIDCILQGRSLYVGCMGGMGRTGLMLALIAKAFAIKSPVPYVRKKYYLYAVETAAQYEFVTRYRVPKAIKNKVRAANLLSYLKFKKGLTRGLSKEEGKLWLFLVDKLAPVLA